MEWKLACPLCKAANSWPEVPDAAECRRCKADLTPLAHAESDRRDHLAECHVALTAGDAVKAEASLLAAEAIRAGPDLRPWRALAALARRDFAVALSHLARPE